MRKEEAATVQPKLQNETPFHGKSLPRWFLSLTTKEKPDLGSHAHTAGYPLSSVPRLLLMYLLFSIPLTSSLIGMLVVLGLSKTPVSFLSGGSVWIASVSSE
ncbi:hypothetical protein F2Q70_00043556 [Brassica cretica]|uniref:Transmembrane protein n=1 Tax=Brassica cretica TaxID=69181 RepID=A0A8S9KHC0_BRACR|nr:hypothetical protein F2Q70_00043556 [Brassica cretica]